MSDDAASRRPYPAGGELQHELWAGGAAGELRMMRCQGCRHLVHPPVLRCPWDHHDDLRWETLSGRGTVESWTESRYSWVGGIDAPYLVALVTVEEDPTARILTNLVDVAADDVTIGMPVEVHFEPVPDDDDGEVHLPLFRPAGGR